MKKWIKRLPYYKRVSKNRVCFRLLSSLRGEVPLSLTDDTARLDEGVPPVLVDWPSTLPKPCVGVIQDEGGSPRWTKYVRFLRNNGFPYAFYDIQSSHWLENARQFKVIINTHSSAAHHLEEFRRKFYVLERHLGICCLPSFESMFLYEDKILEAFLCSVHDLPFIPTFTTHDREEALAYSQRADLPLVSKVVPGSGSVSVEMIGSRRACEGIVRAAFSARGRASHDPAMRQKNYVYFQKYIENDGYDLRIITVDGMFFGYYRKVPSDDFRASGMGLYEKRALPAEAMQIAARAIAAIGGPMLVVDMVRDRDGKYWIVEISPNCQIDTAEQLHVDGKPGVYLLQEDGSFRFEPGRFWVHELALRRVLGDYAARAMANRRGE